MLNPTVAAPDVFDYWNSRRVGGFSMGVGGVIGFIGVG